MKVKLEGNYKRYYTVEEYEQAKTVIAYEKDYDDCKADEWARMAVREYCRVNWKVDEYNEGDFILRAEAHTAKNQRAYNLYGLSDEYGCPTAESGQMDVMVDTYALVWARHDADIYPGVLHLCAFLSDIWNIDGQEDYARYMSGELFAKN